MSAPAGMHRLLLRHGWNLISFPVMPESRLIGDVIDDQLTGADDSTEADLVFGFDGNEG
ncbi:hypothetical protein GF324_00770, partial [bacterium]|nr:hypothetical protein [bacterium]